MSEKTNAHSRIINSVAFSPDGTKIVSACNGRTIKVWDSGAPRRPQIKSPVLGQNGRLMACLAGTLKLRSEKKNAHSGWIMSITFSPDGIKIVSGSVDGAIKVWDSGAPESSNHPSLAKTNSCWLAWQQKLSC